MKKAVFAICTIACLSSHCLSAADQGPLPEQNPPPKRSVLLAACPSVKEVRLTLPDIDPSTGLQRSNAVFGVPGPIGATASLDLNAVISYRANGECFNNASLTPESGAAVEVLDAETAQKLIADLRREVLAAVETSVASTAFREDQLRLIEETLYSRVLARLATEGLKDLQELSRRVEKLETSAKRAGPR